MSTMTLEPCPFCGAKDAEVYPRDRSNLAWNVCCGNPGCVTRGDNDYLTKSDAVAAWNRRAHLANWAGYQQRLEDGKAEERERLSQTSDDRADGDVEITYDVVHGEARVNVYTAQPAKAVDVGAIREVIDRLRINPSITAQECADSLAVAISGENAGDECHVEQIRSLVCNAADNLGDMPVSDAWARKWCEQAAPIIAKWISEMRYPDSPAPGKEGL